MVAIPDDVREDIEELKKQEAERPLKSRATDPEIHAELVELGLEEPDLPVTAHGSTLPIPPMPPPRKKHKGGRGERKPHVMSKRPLFGMTLVGGKLVSRATAPPNLGQKSKAEAIAAFPKTVGEYMFVYADPPLRAHTPMEQGFTWSVAELEGLDVGRATGNHAVCFCWSDSVNVKNVVHILDKWGFTEYIGVVRVWEKRYHNGQAVMGAGLLTKSSCDFLHCAIKPDTPLQKWRTHKTGEGNYLQEYQSVVQPHHECRPDVIRDQMHELLPVGPCLFMFADHPARGFDSWGLALSDYFVKSCV